MEGYEKVEPLRTDGLKRAKGAHAKSKRNPKGGGAPKGELSEKALLAGESGGQTTKYMAQQRLVKVLAEEESRPAPARGMYSGDAKPQDYIDQINHTMKSQFKGRPWKYPSADALQAECMEFFSFMIARRIPVTVGGLSAWLGISYATLRNWRLNQDTLPFYPVVETSVSFIHAMLEQGAVEGRIMSAPFLFLSKNYFGLKDMQELEIVQGDTLTIEDRQRILANVPKYIVAEDVEGN